MDLIVSLDKLGSELAYETEMLMIALWGFPALAILIHYFKEKCAPKTSFSPVPADMENSFLTDFLQFPWYRFLGIKVSSQ